VSQLNLLLSIVGFVSIVIGCVLVWGVGWALLAGGLVLFIVGGVGSAREGR